MPDIFARVAISYGTRTLHTYFAATAPAGSGMIPVASSTPSILRRLTSAATKGIAVDALNANERRALADIKKLGIRLDRSRFVGRVVLIGAVDVIDQRKMEAA